MNISLSKELEHMVLKKVQSGRYLSASEVVREALRLLEQFDQVQVDRLALLRHQVAIGLSELDRGEGIDGKTVFAKLKQQESKPKPS